MALLQTCVRESEREIGLVGRCILSVRFSLWPGGMGVGVYKAELCKRQIIDEVKNKSNSTTSPTSFCSSPNSAPNLQILS